MITVTNYVAHKPGHIEMKQNDGKSNILFIGPSEYEGISTYLSDMQLEQLYRVIGNHLMSKGEYPDGQRILNYEHDIQIEEGVTIGG